jgi:hypothetical protein
VVTNLYTPQFVVRSDVVRLTTPNTVQYLCYQTCTNTITIALKILYNVTVLDHFWTPVVQCYSTEDAVRIVISFITIPITRNCTHSQLFLTLCHIYTAYNHTRSWLQSLITLLHWRTSQLSITVSNYHTLYIFTLRNSRRGLIPRIHLLRSFLRLLLNNCLLNSHSGNWTEPANSFVYIAELC